MESGQVDLSALRALRQQADELVDALSAGAAAAQAEFVGGDEAGIVEVAVDASGAPVRVRLAPDWRQVVGASDLGAAVVNALSSATTQRLAAWAHGVVQGGGHGGARTPPARDHRTSADSGAGTNHGTSVDLGGDGPAVVGDPSSRQAVHGLRDLTDLIAEVTDRLGELAQAATVLADGTVTSTNPARTVRVTTTGGTITAIEFDDEWLRSTTDHERVAGAIQEALAAVTAATASARQDLLDSIPGLDRVRRLTASPETLFREIGLLR